MTKWMLAAGVAAFAMSGPAVAEKGGHGKGGGDHAAHAQKQGGGKAHADTRGGGNRHVEKHSAKSEAQHSGRKVEIADRKGRGDDHRIKMDDSRHDDRVIWIERDDHVRQVRFDRDHDGIRFAPRWDNRGLVRAEGCPPGLAKKGNGCLPPGQEKKLVGTTLPAALAASVLGGPYRDWYRDDDRFFYRRDDDYIYRVNRNGGLIDAFFPYANRDYYYYPVGLAYPSSYNYYNVPYQYRSFYPDGGDTWYRYGDGAIYSVNPTSGLISGIAALLAGDLSVGQPLPPAYSVYNVPLSYRDRYYDTPDAWYRYNDGYIYRVDPKTQLISAVISAIV